MTDYSGGYYLIETPLIKTGIHTHTAELDSPLSQDHLDAVNAVQKTPFMTNDWIVDIIREAYTHGDVIADLPSADDHPLPKRLSAEEWDALSDEERAEKKAERERIHDLNAKLMGRREALLRKLSLAERLRDKTLYFPSSVDWRGRLYPMPQDINPQQDDLGKSMLMFANGKPLGKNGAYHLCLRGAATFGMDKVSFEERVQWFMENEREVIDSARNPLDGRRFWTEADEPWGFLATCREWLGYVEQGEAFISHLPIPQDATCSGLQILSAMGRDSYGAAQTNVAAGNTRRDLYTIVTDRVIEIAERDAKDGSDAASRWLGNVTRKTVKRGVMTMPYGVTRAGLRQQFIKDGHCDALDGHKARNAEYMTSALLEAVEGVVRSASTIMQWLQDCAKALAQQDEPMDWTTPSGMQVRQAYWKRNKKRVATLYGECVLWEEEPVMGIDNRRQALAAAPNVIHSYDAAHLVNTVNMAKRSGIDDFAMIHDSFATHAGEDTRILGDILREEFYHIYKGDPLGDLHRMLSKDGAFDLPQPPSTGDFDISEVLRSDYFFS
ncbi:hypothetical protein KAJ83_01680 [Marivibrio halodurans]|uniref:DNA-directed RNA polymerase n=1 Tax=Marivibrio halodurans TaxID=2039722 RepID=A0A8J7RZ17_9PROT|nr:DNA-directed RNA polymerase [Marivibrio halodurans]MBP5855703.1 hypothetical protein [Marivibrio halodurans]